MAEPDFEIRPARRADAAALVALMRDVIAESRWMLRDPDERPGWWDHAEDYLARFAVGSEPVASTIKPASSWRA